MYNNYYTIFFQIVIALNCYNYYAIIHTPSILGGYHGKVKKLQVYGF